MDLAFLDNLYLNTNPPPALACGHSVFGAGSYSATVWAAPAGLELWLDCVATCPILAGSASGPRWIRNLAPWGSQQHGFAVDQLVDAVVEEMVQGRWPQRSA